MAFMVNAGKINAQSDCLQCASSNPSPHGPKTTRTCGLWAAIVKSKIGINERKWINVKIYTYIILRIHDGIVRK